MLARLSPMVSKLTAVGAAFFVSVAAGNAHVGSTGIDYSRYLQSNGMPCCNNVHCRPAAYYLTSGGLVMFPDGRRVEVKAEKVNRQPATDGLGHWCGVFQRDGSPLTLCALLPLSSA
jgi:hypothetical protein